nr:TolC family protein [Magnetospirillum sulfuroxidans]
MRWVQWGIAASTLVLLSACAIEPQPYSREEFAAKAAAEQKAIAKDVEAISRPLTLPEAVARAVKYNFEARVRMMEEAQALGQLDVSRWELLPKLVANAGYNGRSEPNATRSRGLYSQSTSTSEPTYSQDRDHATADLTATWNLLDFGVGYFNAKAQADRALIATERRRKTLHNLTQEVRAAWWRAASAQKLRGEVARTLTQAEQALEASREVEAANIRNPIDILRYQRSLIDTIRQLETIEQELSTAKTELSVLIGMPPGTEFAVAVPDDDQLAAPQWTMPIERMEEQALTSNADLHEAAYLQRISVQETRRAIVRLFPGITLSGGRQFDGNSFLMANRWWEAGAKVTWNLMTVFSGPSEIKAAEAAEAVTDARALAMHMAVLSQAHIALRQFDIAVRQFQRASQIHDIDKRILSHSQAREAANTQGELERISNDTTMIVGLLRRYQTLAQVHAALGRIQATLGIDPIPNEVASQDINTLTEEIAHRLSKLEGGDGALPADAPTTPPAAPISSAAPVALAPGSGNAHNDEGKPLLSELTQWFAPPAQETVALAPASAAEQGVAIH